MASMMAQQYGQQHDLTYNAGPSNYAQMYGNQGGSGTMGGGSAETASWTSDAKQILIRSLDFNVEPDATYRYRVRIVVRNPNQNRDDVMPGVDNKSEELSGPWSDPTEPVTVQPDVIAFATRRMPSTDPMDDQIKFAVARWNPDDGSTVVDDFDARPGDLIGEKTMVKVPDPTGKEGLKSEQIDFTSGMLVLDVSGGSRPLTVPGTVGELDVPAMAVVMNPDGSVSVRNQAYDANNPEIEALRKEYETRVKQAQAPRAGRGGPGGMPGMPGMPGGYQGGGFGGGGRRGRR